MNCCRMKRRNARSAHFPIALIHDSMRHGFDIAHSVPQRFVGAERMLNPPDVYHTSDDNNSASFSVVQGF